VEILLCSKSITKTTDRRPLPIGPGPLDAYGRKLNDFKTKRSSPTGSTLRNGPVKADYTSKNLYTASSYSVKAKSPQNENYGVIATSSTIGRRVLELVEVEETLNPDDRGTEPYRTVYVSPGIL
jgi:hypothetical protein